MKTESQFLLKNFIRQRLASHYKADLRDINYVTNGVGYFLEFNGDRYAVRFVSPTIISRLKNVPIWDFDLRKDMAKDPICDYYILVGMEKHAPKRIFVVPFHDAPASHVRISIKGVSKYQNYEI